jgi:microcystin-dependent protein
MPGQQIKKGTTYVDYPAPGTNQVTAANLNAHVDNAELLPGAISAQPTSTPEENDYVIVERTGDLFKYTLDSIKQLFASIADGFLPTSGGTMTGPLILVNSTPSTAATAASKGYVDAMAAATVLSGSIVMWGTSTVPSGWLECNGQSTAGYPNLIALFGTNLPDLRGEFIRGYDNGRNVDSGRVLLSAQAQAIQPHTHSYTITNASSSSSQGGGAAGSIPLQTTATTGSTGTTETRPRNVALMFIVKT